MDFSERKEQRLQQDDNSRKGSVDEKIVDLINFINDQNCYATTSSCSGRIVVYEHPQDYPTQHSKKKGCVWLHISHDHTSAQDVMEALKCHTGCAFLKFEAFVLHVECETLNDAQKVQTLSIESGFRNSGMSISKKGKIIAAVRSTLSLEVPLSNNGSLLVTEEFISYSVNICNKKLDENFQRIERFFSGFRKMILPKEHSISKKGERKLPLKRDDDKKQKIVSETDDIFPGFSCLLNL